MPTAVSTGTAPASGGSTAAPASGGAAGAEGGAGGAPTSVAGGSGGEGGVAQGGADAGGGGGSDAGRGGGPAARGGSGGGGGAAGASSPPGPLPKFVGNIDTRGQVRDDLATYWDQLTPENAGKWGSVERSRDQMSWTSLDAMQDYAKQHGIAFKQHNFVWGSQQPSWLNGLSQSEQSAQVEEWIRSYCERYPDTPLIDVVNEPPPHTTPPYLAALGGDGQSGYDWIVQAFKWADQYCPNSILILNDYNNVENSNDNNHTIDIVKRILDAGAPIDAVGAQSHATSNLQANVVQGYIDKIASETGLPVYISEFDLNISDDARQRDQMEAMFTMFWEDPNVPGITLWGYIEGATWVANSGLMDTNGNMRPAMTWLMDFLGR
jgi:endo-1,4-beta-xylanase